MTYVQINIYIYCITYIYTLYSIYDMKQILYDETYLNYYMNIEHRKNYIHTIDYTLYNI